MVPSRPATPGRGGVWEPLPAIVYGYAVHPLSPSHRDTRISSRPRLSTVTASSAADSFVQRDVVTLEVGDEVYAFEKYTPRGKETEGEWYRGYVVCTTRRPTVTWNASPLDPSSSKGPKLEEPQQVFIGIFPASHIHRRDELPDAEGRLAVVAEAFRNGTNLEGFRPGNMKSLPEEDERASRKSFKLGPPPDQANSSRAGLSVYPPSIRSASPTESQMLNKPLPPRPSLKPGDETESGAVQPIVDEIASALREWHMLMFQYLARRDYKLFQTVREHIETLHLGRRQLLAQTLSSEETAKLRRECVMRLVSGNTVQGLDVIVRHPEGGSLVTVDTDGEIDIRNWMSTVRMYALQASLAYMDPTSSQPRRSTLRQQSSLDNLTVASLQTPAHSAFPEYARWKNSIRPSPPSPIIAKPSSVQFYHVFLDVRAFVASPCAVGETAELYFSLYNRNESRFVTEDFCAILNHNGVLARDPSARIRTLFTDLAQSDIENPIYLVCRIVRNGALKMNSSMSTTTSPDTPRRGSASSTTTVKEASEGAWSESSPSPRPVTSAGQGEVAPFRRPFGCAVLEVTHLAEAISGGKDAFSTREYAMPIFQPVNEAIFSMLHQDIIAGNEREYEKNSRAESIAVSLKVFHGNAEKIVKENASLLQDAPLTLRLGFPDVVFPGDTRNELYIKLWSGEFPSARDKSVRGSANPFSRSGGTFSTNNIQVTVEVRDKSGGVVEQVISPGAGEPNTSSFHSLVFSRNIQPTFGELVKIMLPHKGVPQWHIFFTFRQRSSRERPVNRAGAEVMDRPFAFAFLPLSSETQGFLEDGGHTLILYRADRISQIPPDLYLSAPSSFSAGQRLDQLEFSADIMRLAPPIRDILVIRSSLCSTRHTQNGVLLNLLHWNSLTQDKDWLSTVLTKFTFVGEVEIVKFLRDIFDSLFGIIVSPANSSGEMDALVFNALVTVLGIVQDRRFSNFQPVLDVYIEEHFHYALAHSHIVGAMNRLLSNPTAAETAPQLRAALKVWVYIFKFITRSRELQKQKEATVGGGVTADHLEMAFKRDMKAHLAEVDRMMSTTAPASIIGTQTIALRQFPTIIPELAKIFTALELVSLATDFAKALPAERGKIVKEKLIMYLQFIKGPLFDNPPSRAFLVETIVLWIKPHFGRYDEFTRVEADGSEEKKDASRIAWLENIRLCISIIAVMLDKLQQILVNPQVQADRKQLRQEQDNVEFLLSLMPRLLDSYREFQNPENEHVFERVRSTPTTPVPIPVIFPESYPFSLIAQVPVTSKSAPGISVGDGQALFSPVQGEIAIVILALILSSPKKHLVNFFDSIFEIEGRDNFTTLLRQFFKVATSILGNEAWPKNWLNVNILAHKVLVKAMDAVAVLLQRSFIPADGDDFAFNVELWKEGLSMLLKLLSSDQLLIEELSSQKRRAVWRLAGDIRGDGATILLHLWDSLGWSEQVSEQEGVVTRFGRYQNSLSSIADGVVDLCVSHHDQLRNNAVQMLYSMIVSQYREHQHFDDIENELVNKLDSLFMSDSKGDDTSRVFFITQLRLLFDNSAVDETLRQRISSFMDSVDQFLDLLLNVRSLPEGEEFGDDKVIATLRLMNFIRRIGRNEMYIKYVHQLVNMHLQAQNYVEAALTLKLHADLLMWDTSAFVDPMDDLGLPQQSQFHRKETLHLLIIDYLAKGKAWESALELCRDLAYQHQEVTFNYGRLAEIKRHEATLLELIVTEQRYYPDYFRVAFYGNFPAAIQNKQFIYRGYDWEKFGAFCERMVGKHPGARLWQQPGDPPVDIRFGPEQYIQCSAVTPEPDHTLPIFTNPDVPIAVRTYYEHSAIHLFSSSRQVSKLDRDGDEEIWMEKTYYTTEETFPTLLRRSEITLSELFEFSPVENALQDVELRNKELSALNQRYSALAKTHQGFSTNPLSMTLNSVVDAPLGSGVSNYRAAFLNPDYVERFPERVETVEKLRAAIDEQVRLIDSCLRLHALLCPPEMLSFHDTLEKFFRKNFSEEIHRLTFDGPAEQHPAVSGTRSRKPSDASPQNYNASDAISIAPSTISAPHSRRAPYAIPPLPSRSSIASSPSSVSTLDALSPLKSNQTMLQKHVASLTRHGMGTLDGTSAGSDGASVDSPSESFINGGGSGSGGTITGAGAIASGSGSSIVGSIGGSLKLKGRFSRLGSLSFGRG